MSSIDTIGCIIPGYNRIKGMVVNSRSALSILIHKIDEAIKKKERVFITISEKT